MTKIFQALVIVAVCGVPALATEINFQRSYRYNYLEFDSQDGNQSAREDATHFDRFDSDLSRDFQAGESEAASRATQTSEFSVTSILANGSTIGSYGPPVGSSNASGQSHFEVDFSIAEAVGYSLDLSASNSELGHVRLVGPSFSIDKQVGLAGGEPLSISENGIVQPGDYSLLINVSSSGAVDGIVGQYDLKFELVPEPCFSPFAILVMGLVWGRVSRRLRC